MNKRTKPEFEKTDLSAQRMGVSARFLRQLTAEGRVPVHKLGPRCHVYRISDIEAFMEANRIGGE